MLLVGITIGFSIGFLWGRQQGLAQGFTRGVAFAPLDARKDTWVNTKQGREEENF